MNLITNYLSNRMGNELLKDIMRIKDSEDDCDFNWYMNKSLEITKIFQEMKERKGPYGPSNEQ